MKRGSALTAMAVIVLSSPVCAQDDCIRPGYAGALDWSRNDASRVSGIMLADGRDVESAPNGDLYGFLVRSTNSDCLQRIFADYASIVDVCRDADSNRVHAVVHGGSGQFSMIWIWSVDPVTGDPVSEYEEGWVDTYAGGEWVLVGPDGHCRWRERQSARKAVNDAVRALRIGNVDDEAATLQDGESLPVRLLAPEVVEHYLKPLAGIATLEGAVYASDVDRADWHIVQIRGDAICDAPGAVLVLNRRTRQWYSIYDIASGCSANLDYPLYGLRVHDTHLTLSACYYCSGPGDYYPVVIELMPFDGPHASNP